MYGLWGIPRDPHHWKVLLAIAAEMESPFQLSSYRACGTNPAKLELSPADSTRRPSAVCPRLAPRQVAVLPVKVVTFSELCFLFKNSFAL